MRLARGDGVAIFRRDTISYEIREIKSGDVEKRGISGSCGARSRPLFCPRGSIVVSGQRAKSECKRDTRTMNPRAEAVDKAT